MLGFCNSSLLLVYLRNCYHNFFDRPVSCSDLCLSSPPFSSTSSVFFLFFCSQRKVRWLLIIWINNEERNREEDEKRFVHTIQNDQFSIMFGVVVPVRFFFFFEKGFSCPCSWIIHLKFKYYQTHISQSSNLFLTCSNMSHWQVQCVISYSLIVL